MQLFQKQFPDAGLSFVIGTLVDNHLIFIRFKSAVCLSDIFIVLSIKIINEKVVVAFILKFI